MAIQSTASKDLAAREAAREAALEAARAAREAMAAAMAALRAAIQKAAAEAKAAAAAEITKAVQSPVVTRAIIETIVRNPELTLRSALPTPDQQTSPLSTATNKSMTTADGEPDNIADTYEHYLLDNGMQEPENIFLDESPLPAEVLQVKQALDEVVGAGRDNSAAGQALGDLAVTAQVDGMTQVEADLISAMAEKIISGATNVDRDQGLAKVIELAAAVTQSQEITLDDAAVLSQWASDVSVGNYGPVESTVTLANGLLDAGVAFTDIVNTFVPQIDTIDNLVGQGVTYEEIAVLTADGLGQLNANLPAVSTLLDNNVTLDSIVNTWLPNMPALTSLFGELGTSLADALPLTDAMVPALLSADPNELQASLDAGYTLEEHLHFAAMIDSAFEAGMITEAESEDADFLAVVHAQVLGLGAELDAAIAYARNPTAPQVTTYGTAQEAIDANGVPTVGGQPVDEFSVLALPSGVAIDPNNPAAGELTVQEAAQQAQYIEYKNGIADGTIPPDDVRAQYVDAIEAKGVLAGGYDLIATYEQPGLIGNNSHQKYPKQSNENAGQNADGQITYDVSDADAAELINEEAVDAKIQELWNDPTIQADFTTHAQAFVDSLPNKDALAAELSKAIESPEYLYALEDMAASGLAAEATQLTASNLSNLALLDPQLATQTQTNLALSTVASELNAVLADPSLLDAESMGLAIKDSIELMILGLRSGFGAIRHTTGTIDYFAKFMTGFSNDPASVAALSDVFKQLVIDKKNGLPIDLNNISAEQFQSAMERTYIPADLRGGLTQFVAEAQNMGVWGSLSGGACLASFGYKVHNGAFDADSTAEERWGAARDLLSFGSVIGHVAKTGATVFDSVSRLFGTSLSDAAQDATGFTPKTGNKAYQFFGLDRTLPELYGKTSLLPSEMNWSEFWQSHDNAPATLSGAAQQALIDPTGNTLVGSSIQAGSSASSPSTTNAAVGVVENTFKTKAPLTAASTATQIAGTVLKVIGTVTDLFGVADAVMGGIAAKQFAEAGDRPMTAASSLTSISGGFTFAAGVLGTMELAAVLPAVATGAAAGLFMAGAVIGAVALGIMIGVSVHRKNEQRQENTAEQSEFFQRLADQGLMQADWGDKLEYLRNAWSAYGNDNPNQNQSYFDYQQAEWQHFQDGVPSHGSSFNLLSADLHVSNDLTVDGTEDAFVSGS